MEGNNEFHPDRRQYDTLLERVIKVTEDNLKAQYEYLQKLTDIKNKFDLNDRDHVDVKQSLAHITTNTFEMLNKMNKASNEDIIELIEKNNDYHTTFSYKFTNTEDTLKKISTSSDSIIDDLKEIKKNVIDSSQSFSMIQKLLGGLFIIIVGLQIASVAWKTMKDDTNTDNLKTTIQQEIKKSQK